MDEYNTKIDYDAKTIATNASVYVDLGFDHEKALSDAQFIVENIGDRRYVLDNMKKVTDLAKTVETIKNGGFGAVSVDLEGAMEDAKTHIAAFVTGEVRDYVENNETIQDSIEVYTDVMKAVNMAEGLGDLVASGDVNGDIDRVLTMGKTMAVNAAMDKISEFGDNENVQAVKEGAADVIKAVSEMQRVTGYKSVVNSATFRKFASAKAKARVQAVRNIRAHMRRIYNIIGGLEDISSFEEAFEDMDSLLESVDGISEMLGSSEIMSSVRSSMEKTKENTEKAVVKMKAAKSVFDAAKGLFG